MLIGVDYHPSFQQIAFLVKESGEYSERRLNHSDGEAEKFYRDLQLRGVQVRVGMEATGYSRWFERLLAELGFEVWIGDPAEIKARRVKKQKTDRKDAQLLLQLMLEDRFPRIWMPSPENRDLRQLLWHRHRLVQMRTRIMNQLQALAMNEGYRWKKKLFSEQGRGQLEKLALAPWASRRRQELLELLDRIASDDRRTHCCCRAGSQEAARGSSLDDASWRGPAYGPRVCVDHGNSESISSWQADRQLRGDDSQRGLQWWQAAAGAHQQARQLVVALLAGGGSPGRGAEQCGLAASVYAPGDASAQEHCQGGDGTQVGSPLVLDVAKRLRVFAVDGVRFVRGTARYRTWCEVNTVHLIGHPAPCKGSSKK